MTQPKFLGVDLEKLSPSERERLLRAMAELARRSCEGLNLYDPLPPQASFHQSQAKERIVVGGVRSGKTLAAAVEFARAVTGRDPHKKFPESDGVAMIVGKDSKHLGRVVYTKLFRAGAFQMIRDVATGQWRPWRPWEPDDLSRRSQVKPAPPLIPRRYVKEVSWEKKADKVLSSVTLTTGWEIYLYSSLGDPAKGFPVHLVWIDEEIVESSWYAEALSRTVDYSGRLIWSAAPQLATPQLYALHERAQDEAALPPAERQVEEFRIPLTENRYVDDGQVRALERALDEDDASVRVHGGWAAERYKVFHEFFTRVHVVDPFEMPGDWCHYMFVDPGVRVCAVLQISVPPSSDEKDGQVFASDELYIRRADAEAFAEQAARRFQGVSFQAFFIDARSARVSEIGAGRTIHDQYAAALAARKLACVETGSNFHYGSTDMTGRIEALRRWLRIREGADQPILRIFRNCQNLIREMNNYHYRVMANGQITDQPMNRNDHLIWCVGAAAAYTCPYRKPRAQARSGGVLEALKRKRRQRQSQSGEDQAFRLGPPSWR